MEPKLFKSALNNRAEELKKFLPVNVTFNFKTLAPSLAVCEEKYLISLLGKETFKTIYEAYNSSSSDTVLKEAVEKAQYALIYLAIWQDYDLLALQISDSGAQANFNKDNRAYKYQEINLKNTLKNNGFNMLDSLLEVIESNIDKFEAFKTHENYTKNIDSLIKTTFDLNRIFNTANSRLVFIKMKYFIENVEKTILLHRIGKDFFSELILNTEAVQPVIGNIKKYIVYRAISDGISELGKNPTERGLMFEQEVSNRDNFSEIKPIIGSELTKTLAYYDKMAENFMSTAIDFMKKNPEDFPKFITFAGKDTPERTIFRRNNNNKKTFVT